MFIEKWRQQKGTRNWGMQKFNIGILKKFYTTKKMVHVKTWRQRSSCTDQKPKKVFNLARG